MAVDERERRGIAKSLREESTVEHGELEAVAVIEEDELGLSDPNFIDNFVVPFWNALTRPELTVPRELAQEPADKP
jgi:hypothetical protein